MKFTHNFIETPKLKRIDLNNLRLYEEVNKKKKFASITTIISHNTKHKFLEWRKEKGEVEANRITKRSTLRGTKTHTLIEAYTLNEKLPTMEELFEDQSDQKLSSILNEGETLESYKELPYFLFENLKPELNKINNILGIEIPLYSEYLNLAGTSDCIAEYNGKLSIIDYKGSEYIKRREWITDYFVQEVGYRYMLYELTGRKAEQLVILMTAEDGNVMPFIATNFTEYGRILMDYIDTFTRNTRIDYGYYS